MNLYLKPILPFLSFPSLPFAVMPDEHASVNYTYVRTYAATSMRTFKRNHVWQLLRICKCIEWMHINPSFAVFAEHFVVTSLRNIRYRVSQEKKD